MDEVGPNGLGPGAGGTGWTILLSVGRVLLPIGMILSRADISMVDDFIVGLFHDSLDAVPDGPQDTELTVPGNIALEPTAPAGGRGIEVLRSVDERSRTDVFVVGTVVPDVVATDDEDICNAGWDLYCCCISCSRDNLAFSSIVS